MKYFKNFQNHADYEEYIESGEVLYPNVCWCNEEKDIHYDCVKPYISDGLVFHLDGEDCDGTTWADRIGGIAFTMNNVVCDGESVYFKGSTNSYGQSSTVVNYSYNSSTIEVVIRKEQQSGFVFDPVNASAIKYIQGGTNVNFTYGAAGKRSGITTQGLNKIITHSINMDREIYNGKLLSFATNDTWGAEGSGTFIGRRGGGGNPMKGNIYQIRIYNRKLTKEEILYNQEQDRKRYGIVFENTAEE